MPEKKAATYVYRIPGAWEDFAIRIDRALEAGELSMDRWKKDIETCCNNTCITSSEKEKVMEKHCATCGAKLQAGVKFCGQCGTRAI